ncbi:MAG TPA: hypothetical protein VK698_26525 [Kofleriaceae bacterium]|nr:hypothetical protein [Kofleriaceae bacterium]
MRTVLLALSLVVACGGGGGGGAPATATAPTADAVSGAAPAAAAPAAEPGLAPRPFTAEQIRVAMPVGTEIRYRLEETGKPAVIVHSKVTVADAAAMTMVSRVLAEDGSVLSEEPARTTRWDDLLKHASFPADHTKRSQGKVEVPAGTFETLDYVVTESANGATTVTTFRFATALPGPPVSLVVEKGGAVVQRMTLLSRK